MCKQRKERISKLRQDIDINATMVFYHQERPNTFIAFEYSYMNTTYTAAGYAKCCYPDVWSVDFGMMVAKNKALGKIAVQIWENER